MSDAKKKVCFVVMGFGEKTDFESQRVLNLDKSYRGIIKPAVEAAGLECIRADDVIHAGVIDRPMYELLLRADLVVADLSTSNANAIYELGVRHALRPFTTIVLAESGFRFPFDINHLLIRTYEHLGSGLDFEEAERARAELQQTIETLLQKSETDSPVYTFLPSLAQPTERGEQVMPAAAATAGSGIVERGGVADEATSALMDAFHSARAREDFVTAAALIDRLRERAPKDAYLIQQKAFVTYKAGLPDSKRALLAARSQLEALQPETSFDTETLGLWGAVHKRLWESDEQEDDLERAIRAYQRGFQLRDDHYNGINYAYLLNLRAAQHVARAELLDAVGDYVLARRVRSRIVERWRGVAVAGIKDETGAEDRHQTFWVRASLAEAMVGTDDIDGAAEMRALAAQDAPEPWMQGSMENQIARLEPLLAELQPVVSRISDSS